MQLPRLTTNQVTREMIQEFRGINYNERIAVQEWADMENMTGDLYPVASPRGLRRRLRTLTRPNGLFAHEKLCWVDGTDFFWDGEKKGTVTDGPKQMVDMGAYVLIWPDKAYYNTQTDEFGTLANRTEITGEITATLCKGDGTAYDDYVCQDMEPEAPENGALWLDSSGETHVLKQYAAYTGTWTSIPTVYTRISAMGIGVGFSEFDGVSISGMEDETLNGDFYLQAADADGIVVTAVIEKSLKQEGLVTVERKIPDMDFITESENRLWGCSSENHEIYASKLGDPKNFHCYMGLSTDSYAATIGTGGDFTGAITHLGYVLFFKENVIHRVYGTKPANYQITNIDVRGVEAGSEGSLCIVNEVLYYKTSRDVVAFQNALPESVSSVFGQRSFREACAGSCNGKYYISMKQEDGAPVMMVYDTRRGLWHREDEEEVKYFAQLGGELYWINAAGELMTLGAESALATDDTAQVEGEPGWMLESGDIGMEYPDNKYLAKLQIRAGLEAGSELRVLVSYDHGDWEEKLAVSGERRRSFTAPVIPGRCDSLRLRLEGSGRVKIFSITRSLEAGSEMM